MFQQGHNEVVMIHNHALQKLFSFIACPYSLLHLLPPSLVYLHDWHVIKLQP
jgi:hypothetical protein